MAKRILVPLSLKECALSVLPLVADLSRSSGGTVRLLHVAPLPSERVDADGRVVAYQSQEMERIEHDRLAFLNGAAAELDGVPVECVVRFGSISREILLEAEAFGADVIALTGTNRRSLWRSLVGVTAKILRQSATPVMLLTTR
jgi:nucleotide-binding universal stress UspA family protein